MNKIDTSWIKIGQHQDSRELQEEVKKLKLAWPGRWEYTVVPSKVQKDQSYDLYLKHR